MRSEVTVGIFRRGGAISLRSPNFAAHFVALGNEGMGLQNGTRVPRGCFAVVKWSLGCEMEVWKPWVISQRILQLRNGGMGCEMVLQRRAYFVVNP